MWLFESIIPIAFHEYSTTLFGFFTLISFLILLYRHQNKNPIFPTDWPVLGMLPTAMVIFHEPHDYFTNILAHSGGTFLFKGSWLTNNLLFTTNPLNIHHIMSKKFSNYSRGDKFRRIFDILGDGFSNTDGDLWELQRRTIMSLLKLPSFQSQFQKTISNKMECGLMPILEYVSKHEVEIDLHEIFQRFTFDNTCNLLFDYDPQSMSLSLPYVPFEKALSEMGEAIICRYIMPSSLWKLQQLLRMGNEKKLSYAWKAIDEFIYKYLEEILNKLNNMKHELHEQDFKLSIALVREFKDHSGTFGDPNKFLRDILLNLIIATKESTGLTLSWFFYLLANHPIVEAKILEEIHTNPKDNFHKLVYLHGALSETLRLFPPIPFQDKTPFQPDILPSGHRVDQKSQIILSYYSMGRMKSIWGEDCMEFKPERWVSTEGGIAHEPSYKFVAFNVGPRTCLGKDVSFYQMKMVAATIVYHYHVELVEGHRVFPYGSLLLKMKNGLKVKLTKRSELKM